MKERMGAWIASGLVLILGSSFDKPASSRPAVPPLLQWRYELTAQSATSGLQRFYRKKGRLFLGDMELPSDVTMGVRTPFGTYLPSGGPFEPWDAAGWYRSAHFGVEPGDNIPGAVGWQGRNLERAVLAMPRSELDQARYPPFGFVVCFPATTEVGRALKDEDWQEFYIVPEELLAGFLEKHRILRVDSRSGECTSRSHSKGGGR